MLHPEVEDILGPRDVHWPPKGATLNGTLKRGWDSGDPKGFNWVVVNDGTLQEWVETYANPSLAGRNKWTDPDKWHGELACRIEITDDYKTYTVYLKQGVKWHKPSGIDLKDPRYQWLDKEHELTAEDFVFAAEMLKNPQVENGFLKNYYEDLEKVEAIDKYTFVVHWKKKTYQSISFTLQLPPLAKFLFGYAEDGRPFPKETVGLRLNQHWYNNKGFMGAGAYQMTEYKPGSHMTFARNEEFLGEKPAIKEIRYPIYTDRALNALKLKSGELNFSELHPGQYREEYFDWQSKPKNTWPKNNPFLNGTITCERVRAPVYRYLGWNAELPLFKDRRVRWAMSHALNREDILEKIFVGLGEQISGPFMPWTGRADETIKPPKYDLDRSRELLAEAGWKDTDGDGLVDKVIDGKKTPFSFTMLVYGNKPAYSALANVLKEDLLKVGVKMDISTVEWSLMQKKMEEKNFEAYTGGWGAPWESDPFQIWHSSQADVPKGSNRVGFRNKEVDRLIEALRDTFEQEKRKEMYKQIHRILHEEQPYTFFFVQKYVYCWRNDVKGVRFSKDRPAEDYQPWWVSTAL